MRLINTETGEFKEFFEMSKTPPYAILSHTWEEDGREQTYQDVVQIQKKYRHGALSKLGEAFSDSRLDDPEVLTTSELCLHAQSTLHSFSIFWGLLPWWWAFISPFLRAWLYRIFGLAHGSIWDSNSGLSEKVRRACKIALHDGYRYIWIDSSCIDKASSSELSEAINSMYNWYRAARVCYAFLIDVPRSNGDMLRMKNSMFRKSRWFKRGWTLQELIAPLVVVFLSKDWERLGTKDTLAAIIEEITSIDRGILTHKKAVSDESVADRLRWASERKTTRVEDEAYSLLGIFGITMPTLYGEGRYAFRRLQEEILQRIPDQSLFAWGSECVQFPLKTVSSIEVDFINSRTPFAPSPHSFTSSSRGRTIRVTGDSIEFLELPVEEYAHTPYGFRTQLRLLPLQALNPNLQINRRPINEVVPLYLVILGYYLVDRDNPQQCLMSRLCFLHRHKTSVECWLAPNWINPENSSAETVSSNAVIFTLSLNDLKARTLPLLQTKTVYLPHPNHSDAAEQQFEGEKNALNLALPPWARAALQMRGYTVSNVQDPSEQHRNSFSFTLSCAAFNIYIQYRHMLVRRDQWDGDAAIVIEARVWILSPGEEVLRTNTGITDTHCFQFPPYTSTTWADRAPWAVTLPSRNVNLIVDSGDTVTLRLGLELTTPSRRYNILVDSVPPGQASLAEVGALLRPGLKNLPRVLRAPHETFNLILPGSVRRALEMKGYHADINLRPSGGGFCSHCLTISSAADSGFAVVVNYLHTLDSPSSNSRELVVVARVTVESSSDGSGKTVGDGPHVLAWSDEMPWEWSLEEKHVVLTTPAGNPLILHLGFDIAWQSEYYLHVNIDSSATSPSGLQSTELSRPPGYSHHEDSEGPYTLNRAHESISFTLPAHVKRTLEAQGYQIHFERLDTSVGSEPGNSAIRHHLKLSHICAGVTISVEYSYQLLTRYPKQYSDSSTYEFKLNYPFLQVEKTPSLPDSGLPTLANKVSFRRCQQVLTFQASVQTFPSHNMQDGTPSRGAAQSANATSSGSTLVIWDSDTKQWGGWRRYLPKKDITVTLPTTRHQLVLRLSFYLVWYSEYCLTVELNPRLPTSMSLVSSQDDVPRMPDYEVDDKTGMEHIRQSLAESRDSMAEAHDEPLQQSLARSTDRALIVPSGISPRRAPSRRSQIGHHTDLESRRPWR